MAPSVFNSSLALIPKRDLGLLVDDEWPHEVEGGSGAGDVDGYRQYSGDPPLQIHDVHRGSVLRLSVPSVFAILARFPQPPNPV